MNTEQRDTCKHKDREWIGPNWTCIECGDVKRQADIELDGVKFSIRPVASHLNQQEPKSEVYWTHDINKVEAYWKSKQGRCLACGAEIAIEESYCPSCNDFLIEAHESRNPLT
jgi:predicted RNA-binding Zn-ribbon protein involved in translation (DUF1610 family)